jgi:hypothetical protein
MTGGPAHRTAALLLWLATGCAEPAQLGGLGIFDPSGFEGRFTLASRIRHNGGPQPPHNVTAGAKPASAIRDQIAKTPRICDEARRDNPR